MYYKLLFWDTVVITHHHTLEGIPSVDEVKTKIQEIERRFRALKKSTREGLEHRNIHVKVVVECLTDLPADDMPEHKVFLKSNIHILFQAEDHVELFGSLNFYWNYLAYHLLEHIVKELSVEEVKGEMEKYKNDLQQFLSETPAKVFCQAQKKRDIEPPPGFKKLVIKFTWSEEVTLLKVEEFRQQYAWQYNLRECAMLLFSIQDGSFTITWFIPLSIVENLLKMKVDKKLLSNIASLVIAGFSVYAQQVDTNLCTLGL